LSANTLLRAAGGVQLIQHTMNARAHPLDPAWSSPWGSAPFGDDPMDQAQIMSGISFVIQVQQSLRGNGGAFSPATTRVNF